MEDNQLGELLRFRRESIDYRDVRFGEEWSENMAFYFGEQYDPDYLEGIALWRSATVQNIIYPTVEQLHSLITDDESIAFVQREAGGTFQVERILDSIIKQCYSIPITTLATEPTDFASNFNILYLSLKFNNLVILILIK